MKSGEAELLQVVQLVHSSNDSSIHEGDIGTIVEIHSPEVVEVEFADQDGRTRYMGPFPVSDLERVSQSFKVRKGWLTGIDLRSLFGLGKTRAGAK